MNRDLIAAVEHLMPVASDVLGADHFLVADVRTALARALAAESPPALPSVVESVTADDPKPHIERLRRLHAEIVAGAEVLALRRTIGECIAGLEKAAWTVYTLKVEPPPAREPAESGDPLCAFCDAVAVAGGAVCADCFYTHGENAARLAMPRESANALTAAARSIARAPLVAEESAPADALATCRTCGGSDIRASHRYPTHLFCAACGPCPCFACRNAAPADARALVEEARRLVEVVRVLVRNVENGMPHALAMARTKHHAAELDRLLARTTPAAPDAAKDTRNGAWAIGAMVDIAENAELNPCLFCGVVGGEHVDGCALYGAPSADVMRATATRLLARTTAGSAGEGK